MARKARSEMEHTLYRNHSDGTNSTKRGQRRQSLRYIYRGPGDIVLKQFFNISGKIVFLTEKMAPIDISAVEQLKASLSSTASIVMPDSEAYEQSIKRWSETGERRAVRVPSSISCILLLFYKNQQYAERYGRVLLSTQRPQKTYLPLFFSARPIRLSWLFAAEVTPQVDPLQQEVESVSTCLRCALWR
jgi:hypothetical protein